MANFQDKINAMKARTQVAQTLPAGTPPPAAEPVPLNPPAPLVHTAAPTVEPVPAGSYTAPLQPAAKQQVTTVVHTAAAPVMDPADRIQSPGWAQPDCPACKGLGFSSKGHPCRICDNRNANQQKPTSADYIIEPPNALGLVFWALKTDADVCGESPISGKPGAVVVTQERVQTAPVQQQVPTPAPREAPPAHVGVPKDETLASVQAPLQPGPITPIQAKNLEPVGILGNATVGIPPTPLPFLQGEQPKPRTRRTKAQIEADNAKAGVVGMTVPQQAEAASREMVEGLKAGGMVLVIGCAPLKQGGMNCTLLEEVFEHYGQTLADAQKVETYWDMDPFKRRDAFARVGAMMAEEMGNTFLFCNPGTPDLKALVDALKPHAAAIIVAVA